VSGRIEACGAGLAVGGVTAVAISRDDIKPETAGGVVIEALIRSTGPTADAATGIGPPLDTPRGSGPTKSGG